MVAHPKQELEGKKIRLLTETRKKNEEKKKLREGEAQGVTGLQRFERVTWKREK